MLNSVTSLLIAPEGAYIQSLVLPISQHIPTAINRAFGSTGRMSHLTSDLTRKWLGGYAFHPFHVQTTGLEFQWSRRADDCNGKVMVPSNISAVYTPHFQETLVGGVLQGRKPMDLKGASSICRKTVWQAVAAVIVSLNSADLTDTPHHQSYFDVKKHSLLAQRRIVKADVLETCLKGWIVNKGDEEFELDGSGSIPHLSQR